MFLPGKVLKAFRPGEEGKVKYEDGRVSSIFSCETIQLHDDTTVIKDGI